ncbi:odorant receptor 33a-like [Phymastichus coffea]|uniref:odorant receptor 33a-like n=1 Tax=Phymastichus coffea TaxID=108790 RepID=UPI00273C6D7B|nr:odorant receptor 33a-like [Phymastichus coffea]
MEATLTKIMKNNVEYEILLYQFFLLTFWGIWYPDDWSFRRRRIHNIYFSVVFTFNFVICTEMLIHFIVSFGSDEFKLLNFFFVSANITAVYKSFQLHRSCQSIKIFIKHYFNENWMRCTNSEEIQIYEDINLRVRNVTITYSVSMALIVLLKASTPLAESNAIALPVDALYPYPIEKQYWFWFTYFHQVILGSSAICAHIGTDTLFVGLLLKAIGQVNLLKYRLQNLPILNKNNLNCVEQVKKIERKWLIQMIQHHQRIYRFGQDLNKIFHELLIILVISSLPNICINVYSLSAYTDHINVQYIATFFSTTSALIQFFITCWYGNELALKCMEVPSAIYEMNWNMLDVKVQKLLIFMMKRSDKPISFSVGYLIPMNIGSFINIIKTSYTAFNLLQQTTS